MHLLNKESVMGFSRNEVILGAIIVLSILSSVLVSDYQKTQRYKACMEATKDAEKCNVR